MRPREDWDDPRDEEFRRDRDEVRRAAPDDYGQADYSTDYAYDPVHRSGYRRGDDMEEYRRAAHEENERYDLAHPRDHGRDGYRGRPVERDRYRDEPPPSRARGREYEDDPRYARDYDDDRRLEHKPGEERSWLERAFSGDRRPDAHREPHARRSRGLSDRTIWGMVMGRLDNERGLDARDIEVMVENGEVTLNGTVRDRDDKRRAEDLADVRGVTHVQNNLRLRDRAGWRRSLGF